MALNYGKRCCFISLIKNHLNRYETCNGMPSERYLSLDDAFIKFILNKKQHT